MKILFICCCLEPGMDGVGDYTRRLAGELEAQGHSCRLLALADPFVKKAIPCEFGAGRGDLSGLRLPSSDSWADRVRQARHFRETIDPDWISWQIVPYGFDPRGLSFGLGARCREISGACRNHVMFHEIWIGEAAQSSLKHKIIGKLQKFILQDLLHSLRPLRVQTHTPLYRHLLQNLDCPATILPLFGNIPITPLPRSGWLEEKCPEGQPHRPGTDRQAWWIFVLFGTIHPEWDANDFQDRAALAARQAGKKCLLISIGRPGEAGERILKEAERAAKSWSCLRLGRQPEEDISQCLLAADFGVSSVPPEYLFKSGTAVAMVEHGLPIIATRSMLQYPRCPPDVMIGMRNVVRDFDLAGSRKSKPESLLPAVALQFIGDLLASPPRDS